MLRWIVTNWLRNQATQAARKAVQQAAGSNDQQPACDIGIVMALAIEAGGLLDQMQSVTKTRSTNWVIYQGRWQGRGVALIVAGVGREQAAQATQALIAGHQPSWIIATGFSGGLQPGLKHGDLVVADHVALTDQRCLAINLQLPPRPGLYVGRIVTVDQVLRSPVEKQQLGASTDAWAVDMESFAVAEVCQREKLRFLAIRVISDTCDQTLPPEIANLIDQRSAAGRLGAAAGSILKRPGSVKEMWRLRQQALIASDRLAGFLGELLGQLPLASESNNL